MRFGIQLYGVKDELQKNPEAFIKTLRNCGYRRIEPCIRFGGDQGLPKDGLWQPDDLIRMLPLLRALDMDVVSAHVFAEDPLTAIPEMVRLSQLSGIRQYILKCPQEITSASFHAFAHTCMQLADQLRKYELQVLLHNQDTEIRVQMEGKSAYEWLLDACDDKIYAQPDIGWLIAGGEDPVPFLWRNAGRIRSIHYKDMQPAESDTVSPAREVPVGNGAAALTDCFQFARAMGIPQIVDMDFCTIPDLQHAADLLYGYTQLREHTSSTLCTLDVRTGMLQQLHHFDGIIEAPLWLPDGNTLLYNANGHIFRYEIPTNRSSMINTGDCTACNNDHVASPDGTQLAISCSPDGSYDSQIYTLGIEGGIPKRITANGPSYLHGWSPDGKELVYCAFRGSAGQADIYSIPADGGKEKRLTDGNAFNDGPEYSPDGRQIWFNSTRSSLMQIWRMNRDGSSLQQITFSDANNWFPHVSPDGQSVVYLTFRKNDLDPNEHLPNMNVSVSVMNSDGTDARKLLTFFGGQGSINVNSWSPDNRHIALVIYQLVS
ncbi:MAG: hypothetical protein LKF52_14540 [Butyrivibrio sp.]|jgi:Tol biopolymer transport system component/sugar phosphate isomerase/epimerase|nr:hypothetical protein [Butyrivibrio sp.]